VYRGIKSTHWLTGNRLFHLRNPGEQDASRRAAVWPFPFPASPVPTLPLPALQDTGGAWLAVTHQRRNFFHAAATTETCEFVKRERTGARVGVIASRRNPWFGGVSAKACRALIGQMRSRGK
jgi:hypothetical protein